MSSKINYYVLMFLIIYLIREIDGYTFYGEVLSEGMYVMHSYAGIDRTVGIKGFYYHAANFSKDNNFVTNLHYVMCL